MNASEEGPNETFHYQVAIICRLLRPSLVVKTQEDLKHEGAIIHQINTSDSFLHVVAVSYPEECGVLTDKDMKFCHLLTIVLCRHGGQVDYV